MRAFIEHFGDLSQEHVRREWLLEERDTGIQHAMVTIRRLVDRPTEFAKGLRVGDPKCGVVVREQQVPPRLSAYVHSAPLG
jgi:hypothetical protein